MAGAALLLVWAVALASCSMAPAQHEPRPVPPAPAKRYGCYPIARPGLAKFEPPRGCYLGAYVLQDHHVQLSMQPFNRLIGKQHAIFLRYVGYGKPFPHRWVEECKRVGAVPVIAFEPNDGLDAVKDDEYLNQWAKDAFASGVPVFLRWCSEFNGRWVAWYGNPRKYIEKWRLVTRVMRRHAPNVAMVWCPLWIPKYEIEPYYPGREWVDWAGINIYSVHHHNGRLDWPGMHEDPRDHLRWYYRRYARHHPIFVCEYASTTQCKACGKTLPDFAIEKMRVFYRSLPREFPRVKAICWFSYDTLHTGAAENNYAITNPNHPEVTQAYRELIASDYFLSRFVEGLDYRRVELPSAPAAAD